MANDLVRCPLANFGSTCEAGCVLCARVGHIPIAMAVEYGLLMLHPQHARENAARNLGRTPIADLRRRHGLEPYDHYG